MSTSESPLNSDSPGDPGNHVEQTRSVVDIYLATKQERPMVIAICQSAGDTKERIARIAGDITDKSTKTFVAVKDGKIDGFYQYRKCGTTFRMKSIKQLGGRCGDTIKDMISHFRDQLLGKSCNQTCTVQIPKENDIMLAVFKSMGFTRSAAFAPGGVVMVYRVKGGRNRLLQYLNKDWMDSDLKRRIG